MALWDPWARYCPRAFFEELAARFETGFDPSLSISAHDEELAEFGRLELVVFAGQPISTRLADAALQVHEVPRPATDFVAPASKDAPSPASAASGDHASAPSAAALGHLPRTVITAVATGFGLVAGVRLADRVLAEAIKNKEPIPDADTVRARARPKGGLRDRIKFGPCLLDWLSKRKGLAKNTHRSYESHIRGSTWYRSSGRSGSTN